MPILNYNRKLAWVVVACSLWALLAVGWAAVREGRPQPPLRMGYGPDVVTIAGRLRAVRETEDRLTLTIAAPPDQQQIRGFNGEGPEQLPADLEVRFVAPGGEEGPPEISLLDNPAQPRRLAFGRLEIGTRRYIIKISPGSVRILAAPPRRGPGPGDRGRRFERRGGPAGPQGEMQPPPRGDTRRHPPEGGMQPPPAGRQPPPPGEQPPPGGGRREPPGERTPPGRGGR